MEYLEYPILLEPINLAALFVSGLGLGLFYFGGLWLTLQRLARSRQPAVLVLSSFAGRTVICVAGLFVATSGQWDGMAVCMAGFLVMRTILTRRLGLRPESSG